MLAWWVDPAIWSEAGSWDSSTEREAVSNVHDEAIRLRRATGMTTLHEMIEAYGEAYFADLLREVLIEDAGFAEDDYDTRALHTTPLRACHQRRGVVIEWVEVEDGRLLALEVDACGGERLNEPEALTGEKAGVPCK